MAGKEINIIGQKFNKLTAIRYAGNQKWEFECECGKLIIKTTSDVKRGKTKSCSKLCTTGNPSKHPLYQTWDGIKKRCYQQHATGYQNYGGRGIVMSEEWKNSFWQFVSDMGNKPFNASSIERLDNNKNYCKENCIWATAKQQANNRRNNIYISYNGQIYTLFNICKLFNLIYSTTYYNLIRSSLSPQDYFNNKILPQNLIF
jgi:hypothetical protein